MADTEDLVDALAVNLPQLNWAAKIRGQRTPTILPVPRGMMKQNLSLDPTSSDDIAAWAARNIPQFPIEPGKYGSQLAKDVEREFVPSASDTEDQTSYKALKGLFGLSLGGGGGAPGTLAAVKAKGGMWHPEATERLSKQLRDRLATAQEIHDAGEVTPRDQPLVLPGDAWADKAIKNWLNKHAGTSTDPIKDIEIPYGGGTRRLEELTDHIVHSTPAKDTPVTSMVDPKTGRDPIDAIAERFPNEPIWNIRDTADPHANADNNFEQYRSIEATNDYLNHVGDYLRVNVPKDQLNRYDLVRAVQETARADAARAKKMNSAEGRSEGTTLMKEYPDKFRWVEVGKSPLETPEQLAKEGYTVEKMNSSDYPYAVFKHEQGTGVGEVPHGGTGSARPDQAWKTLAEQRQAERAKDALNNEGQVMGHCVGSYCDRVSEGQTKIFSLRDPKGQSHVTIEVRPQVRNEYDTKHAFQAWRESAEAAGLPLSEINYEKYKAKLPELPPSIEQIKGKQNRSPEEKYHPYVQDFVKGGKWGDARELEGVGLTKWKGGYATGPELKLELDQRLLNYTRPDPKEGLFKREATNLDKQIASYRSMTGIQRSDMSQTKRLLREIDRLYTGEAYRVNKYRGELVQNSTGAPVGVSYRDLNSEELLNLRRNHGFND